MSTLLRPVDAVRVEPDEPGTRWDTMTAVDHFLSDYAVLPSRAEEDARHAPGGGSPGVRRSAT